MYSSSEEDSTFQIIDAKPIVPLAPPQVVSSPEGSSDVDFVDINADVLDPSFKKERHCHLCGNRQVPWERQQHCHECTYFFHADCYNKVILKARALSRPPPKMVDGVKLEADEPVLLSLVEPYEKDRKFMCTACRSEYKDEECRFCLTSRRLRVNIGSQVFPFWAHLLCLNIHLTGPMLYHDFISEVEKPSSPCSICRTTKGKTAKCAEAECTKHAHVICAAKIQSEFKLEHEQSKAILKCKEHCSPDATEDLDDASSSKSRQLIPRKRPRAMTSKMRSVDQKSLRTIQMVPSRSQGPEVINWEDDFKDYFSYPKSKKTTMEECFNKLLLNGKINDLNPIENYVLESSMMSLRKSGQETSPKRIPSADWREDTTAQQFTVMIVLDGKVFKVLYKLEDEENDGSDHDDEESILSTKPKSLASFKASPCSRTDNPDENSYGEEVDGPNLPERDLQVTNYLKNELKVSRKDLLQGLKLPKKEMKKLKYKPVFFINFERIEKDKVKDFEEDMSLSEYLDTYNKIAFQRVVHRASLAQDPDPVTNYLFRASFTRNHLITKLEKQVADLKMKLRDFNGVSAQEEFVEHCNRNRLVNRFFNLEGLRENLKNIGLAFKFTQDPKFHQVMLSEKAFEVIKFSCQACFHLDDFEDIAVSQATQLDRNLISNTILYCENCMLGVHKKCYGIINTDIEFVCDVCSYIWNRTKQTNYKKVVRRDQRVCIFCLRTGGAMKNFQRKAGSYRGMLNKIEKALGMTNTTRHFFHVFCGMLVGKFRNCREMKKFKIDPERISSMEDGECSHCRQSLGLLLRVGKKRYHPLCAWLEGCQFNLIKKYNSEKQAAYVKPASEAQLKKLDRRRNDYQADRFNPYFSNQYHGLDPEAEESDEEDDVLQVPENYLRADELTIGSDEDESEQEAPRVNVYDVYEHSFEITEPPSNPEQKTACLKIRKSRFLTVGDIEALQDRQRKQPGKTIEDQAESPLRPSQR